MVRLQRKWINQPSTLQSYHKLHGKNVLYDSSSRTVWFTDGDVISQIIDPVVLSDGWISEDKTKDSLITVNSIASQEKSSRGRFQVEVIWNREFDFTPYGETIEDLTQAVNYAKAIENMADGESVKGVRVVNDHNQVAYIYGKRSVV